MGNKSFPFVWYYLGINYAFNGPCDTCTTPPGDDQFEWDACVCHASEDKEIFVRALCQRLAGGGLKIWYDEFSLRVGDSLREFIEKGLANSRFGIVVLNKPLFKKTGLKEN